VPPFRYQQFCPLARAAEILGERWTLLILRELTCGPRRFSDLRRCLPGISSSVLAQRLAGLESRGLLARDTQPPPVPAALYRLTAEGEALRPVLRELLRFGIRHLDLLRDGDLLEPAWTPLALSAFARSDPVPRRTIAIRIPDGAVEVAVMVSGGRAGTRVERRSGPAEAILRADPLALLGLVSGQLEVSEAVAAGAIAIEGDTGALRDLPALFDLADAMPRSFPPDAS
jgi:DNA-binding HxlR family transcriptional regulator/putative sterol carrier protein